MIENKKQLEITKKRLAEFKNASKEILKRKVDTSNKNEVMLRNIELDAVESMIGNLSIQIKQYEETKNQKVETVQYLSLRDILASQLKDAGLFCRTSSFNDGSGSWIEVHREDPSKVVAPRTIEVMSISFNYSGTKLNDIRVWDEKHRIEVETGQRLF